ncbi:pyridoxal-phosphate dependent enzyme [Legionella waltersii]|uniref:pyridoxal-phosphate dependent enzyme n=1 Tax=Legionella waltersii TaxID=66969 RepID=UPI0007316FDF|nr:pyridoxal-phosphate dependent enzyme [Legionella waltersii]
MWNLCSRVHQLHSYSSPDIQCFVKRDDELGCGISGTKIRKYASLVPSLLSQGIQHLLIIAGPQSNNLLAALQIAREYHFQVTAFLIQPKHTQIQGNFKLSLLFLKEEEIQWIPREKWVNVEVIAEEYLKSMNETAFILSEGASVKESMAGSMTLADDILLNETSLGFQFDHVFIDAGTGFSAIALIKRMQEINHPATIHVLLLADKEEVFTAKVRHWIEGSAANYNCFYPSTARAFGSVNQTIKNEIKHLAYEEGILTDPVYSAKLFYESKLYINNRKLSGKILIVHSGGTITLSGFSF